MFETDTFEQVRDRILARVSAMFDKREGAVIYDAVSPAAFELGIMYRTLGWILHETFADTATREHLLRRASEYGVYPKPAGYAILRAELEGVIVAPGARFSLEDSELNYVVLDKYTPQGTTWDGISYKVQCETIGAVGNQYFGNLLPIGFMPGLSSARLVELLIPGEDVEDTELFRQRYFDSFRNRAFGGNRADYINRVKALPGVGGVKVYPVWNHDMAPQKLIPEFTQEEFEAFLPSIPEVMFPWLEYVYECATKLWFTVGGTVKLVLLGADYAPASAELVNEVQTAIDPERNHGEGLGIAPIGHVVHVFPAIKRYITVEFSPVLKAGTNLADLSWAEAAAREALEAYFLSLAITWGMNNSDTFATTFITVRWAQIMNVLMDMPGLLDVLDLRVMADEWSPGGGECACGCMCCDNARDNIQLHPDEIPALLEVLVHDPA